MSLFRVLFGWWKRPDLSDEVDSALSVPVDTDPSDFVPDDKISIIITGMNSNDGMRAAKVIARLLSAIPMLSVRRSSQKVDVEFGSSMAMVGAIERTRDALMIDKADVAICGAATGDGAAVGLWFVSADENIDNVPGRFSTDDILIAPADFPVQVQNAIAASVVAAACAASPNAAQRLAPALKHYAEVVWPLVDDNLQELPSNLRAGLFNAIGNVLTTRARYTRSESMYDRAATAYRKAATGFDPTLSPLSWAGAKSHLAQALQALASVQNVENEDGEDGAHGPMQQAIALYSEIAEALSAEAAPRAWAQAQIEFAMLTYRLAVKEGTQKPFRDALKALQAAQTVFTRQTMPSKWSEIMNNMGVILLTMGEDRADDGILKHSIASFEQAMQVRRRETMPKLWAQTANNLGAASFALAKRTRDKEVLTGAARNFEGAKEVYEQLGQTQRANVIEKNLSRVRRLMDTTGD